jgi:hypothetical protein
MHHTYPVPRTTQPPTDAKPKYGRLFFHVAVAGTMVRGFLGLNDLAAGKHIENQVSGELSGEVRRYRIFIARCVARRDLS